VPHWTRSSARDFLSISECHDSALVQVGSRSGELTASAEEPHLCLVIPCYNEAARLNVPAFRDFVVKTGGVDVVFVDDGSDDSTASVLAEIREGLEHRVNVITCSTNRGKAEAVRLGILEGIADPTYRIFGYWDADLATPLNSVCRLAKVLDLNEDVDLVLGSRVKLCGRHIERRAVRHYLGRVFATAVSVVLRLPIYDTQCGAKLFRATAEMKAIFAQPFLSRWIFDVEILARMLVRTNPKDVESRTYEYPLEEWRDISGSKLRPKDFFRALFDIVRIKNRYF
jgi:dolichyl-phosphate beta-glucosyltransferase